MYLSKFALILLALPIEQSAADSSSDLKEFASFADSLQQDDLSVVFGPGIVNEFDAWMKDHSKVYNGVGEKLRKMKVWLSNHESIEAHNNVEPVPSYTLGHNQYSDMTHDEFKEYFSLGEYSPGVPDAVFGKKSDKSKFIPDFEESKLRGSVERRLSDDLPDEKDWRTEGAIMTVKNQGKCGSCWAFSATGAIEGSMYVNGYTPRNLSVEELVDCDKSELGCSGGLMDSAFITEEGWGGMCSWEDYEYDAPDHPHDLTCRKTNCTSVEGSAIKSFIDLSPGKNIPCEEDDLAAALVKQPVAIAIQANQLGFMFYKEGVLDSKCGASLDHGVLAVGFGEEDGKKFWIVKNSWGEKWGEDGYIRIAKQSDEFDAPEAGQCGILMLPSYPEV